MAVKLNKLLRWTSAQGDDAAMLEELQANILKGHVREHLSVLFLRFEDANGGRAYLASLCTATREGDFEHELVKSAKTQLDEVTAYNAARRRGESYTGTPYVGVGLSFPGYDALGVDPAKRPPDPSFRRGMRAAATRLELSDPPVSTWEAPYREAIHAIVLIGDATEASVGTRRNAVIALLPESVTVVGEETGVGLHNGEGRGIEHFGYIDGRSQPLFLKEDLKEERATTDGVGVWNPAARLDRVLVPDPAGDAHTQYGSYLVFRKLEQNVQRFKAEEERLANDLGLLGDDAERAGAMLVGRFEDGTPLTLQQSEGAHNPVMNSFTYKSDRPAMRCPLYAHIRKVNPRDSDRKHLMARRGQAYGVRSDDVNADLPASSRPVGGVGLLFMAFNANIAEQFEHTQHLANLAGPDGGADQIIGQGPRGTLTSTAWGEATAIHTDPVAQAVTMKGGEYFFMPSRPFLKSLSRA